MGFMSHGHWCWDLKWRRNLFDHEQGAAVAFMETISNALIQPHLLDLLDAILHILRYDLIKVRADEDTFP